MIKKCLNGGNLKIIAAVSMLIDHIAFCVLYWFTQNGHGMPYGVYDGFRFVGRLAFPIYCFLLSEGFVYTKNRPKYALRLGIFALVSEIPFDLMCRCTPFSFDVQNVYFTLLLGFLAMWCVDRFINKIPFAVIGVALCCSCAHLLKADYGVYGVLLITFFYIIRSAPQAVRYISASVALFAKSYASVLAIVPIFLYNGKKGKVPKYLFYAFYPVHILILCAIRYAIFGF